MTDNNPIPFGVGKVLDASNPNDLKFQWVGNKNMSTNGTFLPSWYQKSDDKAYYKQRPTHPSHEPFTNGSYDIMIGNQDTILIAKQILNDQNRLSKQSRDVISTNPLVRESWGSEARILFLQALHNRTEALLPKREASKATSKQVVIRKKRLRTNVSMSTAEEPQARENQIERKQKRSRDNERTIDATNAKESKPLSDWWTEPNSKPDSDWLTKAKSKPDSDWWTKAESKPNSIWWTEPDHVTWWEE